MIAAWLGIAVLLSLAGYGVYLVGLRRHLVEPNRASWLIWAAAAGVDVSFWLTGESTWFALPGRAAEFELPHAAPLPDLLAILVDAGQVTACTQCAARRGITPQDVLPGIRIAGAAVFVEEIMSDGAQAVVY